jgi:vancomycin resistance protein YoaR
VAHIFVRLPGKEKSEIVDGRGGGVCQVSSTLYNAVRKTNNKTDDRLAIIERNNHSLPVSYVPSGLDATVAWPHKDFRFRNTFPHPVYLRAQVSGSRLKISVWGRVPEDTSSITASTDGATATETFADSPT